MARISFAETKALGFGGILTGPLVVSTGAVTGVAGALGGVATGEHAVELLLAGANAVQVVLYGVVPQIVPDFLSYTIYHWDINVRISTIIGYVGGGGIGYYLSQMINTSQNNRAGTAIWAIVAVVWTMDFLSAEVRKRYA